MWVACACTYDVTCDEVDGVMGMRPGQDGVHQSAAVAVSVACLSCLRLIKCGSLGPVRVHRRTELAASSRG